jgi:hypothetical protein
MLCCLVTTFRIFPPRLRDKCWPLDRADLLYHSLSQLQSHARRIACSQYISLTRLVNLHVVLPKPINVFLIPLRFPQPEDPSRGYDGTNGSDGQTDCNPAHATFRNSAWPVVIFGPASGIAVAFNRLSASGIIALDVFCFFTWLEN